MIELKEVTYAQTVENSGHLVLAADIGGTNSNFGICDINLGHVALILSVHAKSKEITDFPQIVDHVLKYLEVNHEISVKRACFACAGVVSENRDFCKPTNLDFEIDAHAIKSLTGLQEVIIINDFEAVGYGVDRIAKQDLVVIHEGKLREQANRAIIGAGTGLGKNILGWDYSLKMYIPIPSEGGHADFPIYNQDEFDYMKYLQNIVPDGQPISWEDVLSGQGIVQMYNFLGIKNTYEPTEIAGQLKLEGITPERIFKHRQDDKQCGDTYKWYSLFYARCAKNFALEALSLGGLYIAGGIAAQNLPLFQLPEFMKEFLNSREQKQTLSSIRISIVTDYNVSLYGAGAFLAVVGK